MDLRKYRFEIIVGLAIVLIGIGCVLLCVDLQVPKPGTANDWPVFVVPDAAFSVRFPAASPVEADLSTYLIDRDLEGAKSLLADVKSFRDSGGTTQGWSHLVGDTAYSIRVNRPPAKDLADLEKITAEVMSDPRSIGFTNLPRIDEWKSDIQGIKGRCLLTLRPNGNRILTYFFGTPTAMVLLFVERPGNSLTPDDPNARVFFSSVKIEPR